MSCVYNPFKDVLLLNTQKFIFISTFTQYGNMEKKFPDLFSHSMSNYPQEFLFEERKPTSQGRLWDILQQMLISSEIIHQNYRSLYFPTEVNKIMPGKPDIFFPNLRMVFIRIYLVAKAIFYFAAFCEIYIFFFSFLDVLVCFYFLSSFICYKPQVLLRVPTPHLQLHGWPCENILPTSRFSDQTSVSTCFFRWYCTNFTENTGNQKASLEYDKLSSKLVFDSEMHASSGIFFFFSKW